MSKELELSVLGKSVLRSCNWLNSEAPQQPQFQDKSVTGQLEVEESETLNSR
jgi:hypothetical protein